MARVVALLRSVNVGGNRMKMDFLRDLARDAGCHEVDTLLATGNVLLAPPDDLEQVRIDLEELLAERFGPIAVIMRSHGELVDALERNPWSDDVAEGRREGRFVQTMFLQSQSVAEAVASLVPDDSDDRFVVDGREIFAAFAGSTHDSRYQAGWFERHLGVTGTSRNHNTVVKLVAATN